MKYALVTALTISLLSGLPALVAEGRDYNPERDRVQERRDSGPAPRHQWRRGERLPAEFARGHEVFDWRARRLRPPPRGYHWVNVDGDFILASLATGVVLDFAFADAYAYPPSPYPGDYPEPDPGAYPPYNGGVAPPPGPPYQPPPGASAPNWYYCADPRGYYPYVRSCNQNWEPVPSAPPPTPGRQ